MTPATLLAILLGPLVLPPGAVARFGDPRAHSDAPAPALSPDGRYSLFHSDCVIDTRTGERRRLPGGPDAVVCCHEFTADGRIVMWDPPAVRFFDPATNKETGAITIARENKRSPSSCCVSAGGRVVALHWGDPHDKVTVHTAGGIPAGVALDTGKCDLMAVSGDGTLVAVKLWDGDRVGFCETRTGKQVATIPIPNPGNHYVGSGPAAFSPDGRTFAHFEVDLGLVLYSSVPGGGVRAAPGPTRDDATQLQFAPDGKALTGLTTTGDLVTWDAETAKELRRVRVGAGELSRDGSTIVVTPGDGPWQVRDVASGRVRYELPHQGPVTAVEFVGATARVTRADAFPHDWDFRTGRSTAAKPRPVGRHVRVRDERAEVVDANGRVAATFPAAGKYPHDTPVAALANGLVAVTDRDGEDGPAGVAVYREATRRRLFHVPDAQGEGTSCLAFSPDGRFLVCGLTPEFVKNENGYVAPKVTSVVVVELASGTVRRSVVLPVTTGYGHPRVCRLAFDAAGRRLAVSLTADAVVLDLPSGRVLVHDRVARVQAFSPDGRWLVRDDGRVVDVSNPDRVRFELWPDGPGPEAAAFSADGRQLITGYANGCAVVWDVATFAARAGPQSAVPVPGAGEPDPWAALGDPNAAVAGAAMDKLAADPVAATRLAAALKPVVEVPAARLTALVAKLDADAFADREAAEKELAAAGEQAAAALRVPNLSAEARTRAARLLDRIDHPDQSPERLRALRVVELLERIATPAAKEHLRRLAAGAASAHLTRHANAALARLGP